MPDYDSNDLAGAGHLSRMHGGDVDRPSPSEYEDPPRRTPDQIMADFYDGIIGAKDVDMTEVLWEVIEDIIDSCRLAVSSAAPQLPGHTIAEVITTVRDYAVNNYGEH